MARAPGIRTRVMLVSAVILVIVVVTSGSLLIVRSRVRRQAAQSLSADLIRSLATFQNLQLQRREALIHENALLADLPSLKALMTTGDQRTIADGATEFWKVSGSDLFALADKNGRVLTTYTRGAIASPQVQTSLQRLMGDQGKHYLAVDAQLFDYAVRPLFFGKESSGVLLGYVISGYAVDRDFVHIMSQAAAAQASFIASGRPLSSTLSAERQQQLARSPFAHRAHNGAPSALTLGGEDYLAAAADLSDQADSSLMLVVCKSLVESQRAAHEINRLVALLGLAASLLGSVLMVALSSVVTSPLELLAKGVSAFGFGDPLHSLPKNGTREVRELSAAFTRMRHEILEANRARLESERLATIGRMASSVSHDLRHYLAAVYANAEFLSSPLLSDAERLELFSDIQVAVYGTTELIDSLLIFSKDSALQRARKSVLVITQGAIGLLRAHPEAENVAIHLNFEQPYDADAFVDAKKVERALYNLLLNACQSARKNPLHRSVEVHAASTPEMITINITDSGTGVSDSIRDSLFEPFVSEGKQSGTGLGLTLAHAIAKEHGGAVTLLSTRPGQATFQLALCRNLPMEASTAVEQRGSMDPEDANRRTNV